MRLKMTFPDKKTAVLLVTTITAAVMYIIANSASVPVSPAAGYFLSVAADMAAGNALYSGIHADYTPLGFYLFELWAKVSDFNYTRFLLFQYAFHFINMVLIYMSSRQFSERKSLCWFTAGVYFLIIMTLDGMKLTLEPFMMCWVLGAYVLYLRTEKTVMQGCMIGVFLGIAVLFKQHAILFLPAFLFTYMLDEQRFSLSLLTRICATGLCSMVPFLLYLLLSGLPPYDALQVFSRIGANTLSYNAGQDFSTNSVRLLMSLLKQYWISLPLAAYIYFRFVRRTWPYSEGSLVALVVVTAIPLIIRPYPHYYQMLTPWIVLLWVKLIDHCIDMFGEEDSALYLKCSLGACTLVFGWCGYLLYNGSVIKNDVVTQLLMPAAMILFALLSLAKRKPLRLKEGVVVLAVCVFMLPCLQVLKTNFSSLRKQKLKQFKLAAVLDTYIPRGSKVLIFNAPELYFTGRYKSPVKSYTFSFQLPEKVTGTIVQDWEQIPAVIYRGKSDSLKQELEEHGFTQVKTPFTNHFVFKKKNGKLSI